MRRNFILLLIMAVTTCFAQESRDAIIDSPQAKKKIEYQFSASYRVHAGYAQDWQRSSNDTYPDVYLHGGKIGFSVDMNLPYNLSIQTGLTYSLTGNTQQQHWRSLSIEDTRKEYIEHHLLKHNLEIPIHLYYTQKLWRQLNMVFFTGPNFNIGLALTDNIEENLSPAAHTWLQNRGLPTSKYDQYSENQLYRFNLQWSIGGGFEWDKYRLYSGYNFGLNNICKQYPINAANYNAKANEWGWFVSFAYKF